MRALLVGICLVAACRPDPSAAYLQRELRYFQGYVEAVDPEREAREVRRVLAQRQLAVQAEVHEPSFVALGAHERGGPRSAVRVITRRGVAVGVDGDLGAPLAPSEVELVTSVPSHLDELELVALSVRPRALDLGCLRLYRVLADGRVVEQQLDVSALGSRACVAELRVVAGHVFAVVGFPGLAQLRVPRLPVELELETVPLGRPDPLARRFVLGVERGWMARAEAALSPDVLAREPELSGRHAIGVARAALAAMQGRGLSAQRATYLAAVGRVPAGSAEAALVADTLAHIERGWLDEQAAEQDADAGVAARPEASDASTDAEQAPVAD